MDNTTTSAHNESQTSYQPHQASEPSWLRELRIECAATSVQEQSVRLGYSRTALSLALRGKYGAGLSKLQQRFESAKSNVDCPHLHRPITLLECRTYHVSPCNVANRDSVNHFKACRVCIHNAHDGPNASVKRAAPAQDPVKLKPRGKHISVKKGEQQ
jgi:hypothetical protein